MRHGGAVRTVRPVACSAHRRDDPHGIGGYQGGHPGGSNLGYRMPGVGIQIGMAERTAFSLDRLHTSKLKLVGRARQGIQCKSLPGHTSMDGPGCH